MYKRKVSLLLPFFRISRNCLVKRSQLFLMGDNELGVYLDTRDPEGGAFYLPSPASCGSTSMLSCFRFHRCLRFLRNIMSLCKKTRSMIKWQEQKFSHNRRWTVPDSIGVLTQLNIYYINTHLSRLKGFQNVLKYMMNTI